MRKESVKETVKKVIMLVISAFLYALAMKLIVQPNKFLSGGVSGVTVLISRFTAIALKKEYLESLLYSILYVMFNIPIFIFGFKKVGKQFIYYSVANVLIFSVLVSLVPTSWISVFQLDLLDSLTSAVLAGLLSGVSAVISFSNGFSSGGTDIISMYLSRSKGKGIGNYNFAMNVMILIAGGIMFKNFGSLIYTVIYFFVNSLVINNLYIGHKKVMIEIITDKNEELVDRLMKESNHGCTILNAIGAYSKKEKQILRVVVSANQTKRICEIIQQIDCKSFTTIIDVRRVDGKFYVPPIK